MANSHPKADYIRALRQDSRNWWYHVQLRGEGNIAEARAREHNTVKRNIECIRAARNYGGVLTIGQYGMTFYYEPNSRASGLHPFFVKAIAMAGIPVLDCRNLSGQKLIAYALRKPLLALDIAEDELPMTSLSYITPLTYIAIAREYGVEITNDPGVPLPAHVPPSLLF